MHIDDYDFGWMVIDGQRYDQDLIIAGDKVIPNWWRQEGHSLALADLEAVLAVAPDLLVVGTGETGRMRIPRETREALGEKGIVLEAYDTAAAINRFNQLTAAGRNVSGAFHLTC